MAIDLQRDSYYSLSEIARLFDLREEDLREAVQARGRRLKAAHLGGALLVRGDHLIEWLEGYIPQESAVPGESPGLAVTRTATGMASASDSPPSLGRADTPGLMRSGEFEEKPKPALATAPPLPPSGTGNRRRSEVRTDHWNTPTPAQSAQLKSNPGHGWSDIGQKATDNFAAQPDGGERTQPLKPKPPAPPQPKTFDPNHAETPRGGVPVAPTRAVPAPSAPAKFESFLVETPEPQEPRPHEVPIVDDIPQLARHPSSPAGPRVSTPPDQRTGMTTNYDVDSLLKEVEELERRREDGGERSAPPTQPRPRDKSGW